MVNKTCCSIEFYSSSVFGRNYYFDSSVVVNKVFVCACERGSEVREVHVQPGVTGGRAVVPVGMSNCWDSLLQNAQAPMVHTC